MITSEKIMNRLQLTEDTTVQIERLKGNIFLNNVPDAKTAAIELQKLMQSPYGVKVFAYDAHTIAISKKNYMVSIDTSVRETIKRFAKDNNWNLA
jgi:hypothetical protein